MNSRPIQPQHRSYRLHRRQVAWQIVAPVVVAGLLVIGLIFLVSWATFRGNGDVSRWAAISTIWLVIPVMIAGLIALAVLVGLAYLLGRITDFIPSYSRQAQLFAFRIESGAKRVGEIGHRPAMVIPEIGRLLMKAFNQAVGRFRGERHGK